MNRIAIINHYVDNTEGFYGRILEGAKRENLKDIIANLVDVDIFQKIILQTNRPDIFSNYKNIEIEDTSRIPEFGARIKQAIKNQKKIQLFYTGSGSSVFLDPEKIRRYISLLKPGSILANNLYSTDYFFIDLREPMDRIEDIKLDNSFSRKIIERYRLKGLEIERNEYSLFDMDGPLDILALKLSGRGGKNLKRYLKTTQLDNKVLTDSLYNFTDKDCEILFWGRISEFLITFLRYRTACRTKFVIEGRGLVSQGDLNFYSLFLDSKPNIFQRQFYKKLETYCNTLFVDSRIIFAHYQLKPFREDRFALDMLDKDRINNKRLSRLCKLSKISTIPVIFCNHSFLNSGIPLLIDYIWTKMGFRGSKFGSGIIKDIVK